MEAKTVAHEAFSSILCGVWQDIFIFILVNVALCAIMETLSI